MLSSIEQHRSQVIDLVQVGNDLQSYAESENTIIIHMDLRHDNFLQHYRLLETSAARLTREMNVAIKERSLLK